MRWMEHRLSTKIPNIELNSRFFLGRKNGQKRSGAREDKGGNVHSVRANVGVAFVLFILQFFHQGCFSYALFILWVAVFSSTWKKRGGKKWKREVVNGRIREALFTSFVNIGVAFVLFIFQFFHEGFFFSYFLYITWVFVSKRERKEKEKRRKEKESERRRRKAKEREGKRRKELKKRVVGDSGDYIYS
jgi:hypothetical protein